jgi:transposase
MSKIFRAWDVDQEWLLPPSVHEFVPAGHMAHFVRDTVRVGLDLSAIMADYAELRGQPPYHPGMMLALLLYGYSRGVYASRRLAQACEERVDFMAVTGMQRPDFHTISEFRRRHLKALPELFVQVLKLCQAAGLVKLGHVAIDGSKLRANANRHKAMSYARMKRAESELQAEIEGWLKTAEAEDQADDAAFGEARRGDEMPQWVADKQQRLERIKQAKAALEAEAKLSSSDLDPDGPGPSSGMRKSGRDLRAEDGGPPDRAQRNFTDPDSRIQPTAQGFIAGYNGQIAVDGAHQIIIAQRLTTNPADHHGLMPLIDQAKANLGRQLSEVSADSGFANEANLEALAERCVNAYLAPAPVRRGKDGRDGQRDRKHKPLMAAMAQKLKRAGRRSRYRLRKQIVEPVFGQIKQPRGFRQFLLRGLKKVQGEWSLICTVHNLNKLASANQAA